MTSSHFLDTAVFIGYCFYDDGWSIEANRELDSSEKKWSSDRVKHEFEKKYNFLFSTKRKALLQTKQKLIQNIREHPKDQVARFDEILTLLPSIEGNSRWLKDVIHSLMQNTSNKNELVKEIDSLLIEYSTYCMSRYKRILDWCKDYTIECWLRLHTYPSIISSFHMEGMMNDDDNEILLDAHDLCCNVPDNIHFVTGDKCDIKNHEQAIIAHTNIKSIIYLGG